MIAYRYNPATFIYEDEVPCQKDIDGTYLLPEFCTFTAPEKYPEESVIKNQWNPKENKWVPVEDHRRYRGEDGNLTGGTPYWLEDDVEREEPRYMKEIGPLPEGALLEKPKLTPERSRKKELQNLISEEKYSLIESDYKIIKSIELGVDPDSIYPGIKAERQRSRDLINQYEEELKQL